MNQTFIYAFFAWLTRARLIFVFLVSTLVELFVLALILLGMSMVGPSGNEGAVRTVLLVAIVTASLVVTVVVAVARQLVRRVDGMTSVVEQIAQGDLTIRAPVETTDEIGRFAHALNRMAERLQQSVNGLEQRNQQLYREIAERRQAHRWLQRYTSELQMQNEELDAFAHALAHDLRNPLGVIVGFAEALSGGEMAWSEDELRSYFHTMARNGRRMNDILDGLLLLTGVSVADVELTPLDMGSIVGEVLQRLAYLIEESEAQIVLADDWPTALGYGPWIEEVWANYLSVALKHSGESSHIELGAAVLSNSNAAGTSSDETNSIVRFWVRELSPGRAAEGQVHRLTPGGRLAANGLTKYDPGLSIAKRIVEKLGGRVYVHSTSEQRIVLGFSLRAVEVGEPA